MVRRMVVLGSVLAVATAAAASAATSGVYTGTTSQGLAISLKVNSGKVVNVNYIAKYGSCGEFTGNKGKVALAITNNKFSGTAHLNSETVIKLAGSFFLGNSVKGTLSATLTTGGIHPMTCKTGTLTFTAKH
ncbi:MAG: hypothetical protein M3071_18015 [Actinomycetota bacterium]|nr:hypothetical protein [Actinomycetota bacterium]